MSDITPGRPDLAVASVLAGGLPSRIRICVDLSRPFTTNRMVADFEDCLWIPAIGDLVTVFDPDVQREATADVVGLDEMRRTVALAVDWTTLVEVSA